MPAYVPDQSQYVCTGSGPSTSPNPSPTSLSSLYLSSLPPSPFPPSTSLYFSQFSPLYSSIYSSFPSFLLFPCLLVLHQPPCHTPCIRLPLSSPSPFLLLTCFSSLRTIAVMLTSSFLHLDSVTPRAHHRSPPANSQFLETRLLDSRKHRSDSDDLHHFTVFDFTDTMFNYILRAKQSSPLIECPLIHWWHWPSGYPRFSGDAICMPPLTYF